MIAVVAFIVLVERGERRIPVQYAKRIVGRRMMGGQSTHLPLKVNAGGVMPVIFACSILSAPLLFARSSFVQATAAGSAASSTRSAPASRWYELLYMRGDHLLLLLLRLDHLQSERIADNMRKYGGFIPGIRPGKRTADYINNILTRITVVGALYLSILSLIPQIMITGIHLQPPAAGRQLLRAALPTWVTHGLGVNFYFGGTSLLIVVGVAMDTVNQIEAQLIMRHYEGFTPRSGRVRGRRAW